MKLKERTRIILAIFLALIIHFLILYPFAKNNVNQHSTVKSVASERENLNLQLFSILPSKENAKNFSSQGEVYSAIKNKKNAQKSESKKEQSESENSYELLIKRKIIKNKYYPLFAQKTRKVGTTILYFVITPKGELAQEPKIIQTSSFAELDNASIEAVKSSQPFPPFPANFKPQNRSYKISLKYQLK